MKIVFFGTPEFAVTSLDALIREGFDVAAVVTMPDKPAGRGKHLSQSAVKKYAVEHNLPVLQPEKLKDPGFVDTLRAIGADLFIVIAFRMMPEVVWSMPPLGTFNLHASLLPLYRGAAPINRAVMNGDSRTGVTTFMLKHEIDTGDILQQESIEIGPDENVGSVHDRLMELGAALTVDTVRHLEAGDLQPIPQDKISHAAPTAAPKIFKEDCRIDWQASSATIHNHVRGLSPYPAAWSELWLHPQSAAADSSVKILRTRLTDVSADLIPGQLAIIGKKAYAGTADGIIELTEVQPAGKRPMNASDFLRGLRIGQDGRIPVLK